MKGINFIHIKELSFLSSQSCNEPEPGSNNEEVINEPILLRLNTDKARLPSVGVLLPVNVGKNSTLIV